MNASVTTQPSINCFSFLKWFYTGNQDKSIFDTSSEVADFDAAGVATPEPGEQSDIEDMDEDSAQVDYQEAAIPIKEIVKQLQNQAAEENSSVFSSPFEALSLYIDKDDMIKETIQCVNEFSGITERKRLADRLMFLLKVEQEENPEDWSFSQASLAGFLTFMGKHQNLNYPDVGLSPDGLLQAQWREEANRNLLLEFLDFNTVQFAIFAPTGEQISRLSGITTPEDAWQVAKDLGAERWAVND